MDAVAESFRLFNSILIKDLGTIIFLGEMAVHVATWIRVLRSRKRLRWLAVIGQFTAGLLSVRTFFSIFNMETGSVEHLEMGTVIEKLFYLLMALARTIFFRILLSAYIDTPPTVYARKEQSVPVNSELVGVVPTHSTLLSFHTQRAAESERTREFFLIDEEVTPNCHEIIIPIRHGVTYPQNSEVVIGITSPVPLSAQEGDELVIPDIWSRGTSHVN